MCSMFYDIMIRLKSNEEIQILKEGGKKLSQILQELKNSVVPGAQSIELEELAKKLIKEAGGEPAFLGYAPGGKANYPAALCLSINEAIVHTPAINNQEIKEGDIVSLDLGFKYKGMITDMATSTIVGEGSAREWELLAVTKRALEEAIKECMVGESIYNIGKKIEQIATGAGFNVIRELTGHGVGYEVHEDPTILNFYDSRLKDIIMEEGLVIAIEPMVTMKKGDIELAEDNWTYRTCDKSLSAHFEATIAVTADGPVILTPIV